MSIGHKIENFKIKMEEKDSKNWWKDYAEVVDGRRGKVHVVRGG